MPVCSARERRYRTPRRALRLQAESIDAQQLAGGDLEAIERSRKSESRPSNDQVGKSFFGEVAVDDGGFTRPDPANA